MEEKKLPDEHSVFLNFPFAESYEKNYVALITSIICVGRKPKTVIELPDYGQGRLERLINHIRSCRVSIHDLSRVGLPVRFNMPFELGLAYGIRERKKKHDIIMLEKLDYRLDRTLSDVKGIDPLIHYGKPKGIIDCVINALPQSENTFETEEVYKIWRNVWNLAKSIKKSTLNGNIYNRKPFEKIVAGATYYATELGLLKP